MVILLTMPVAIVTRIFLIIAICPLLMLVLTSCEEPVDLGLEIPKSRLVLSSSFLPGEAVVLRVSATRPLGDGPVREIDDAQVSLFEGNELAEELTYVTDTEAGAKGYYRTTNFKPVEGREYTIYVAASGFDPVTAISSIPQSVAIRSLEILDITKSGSASEVIYDYFLRVEYDDPTYELNFYDLRISQLAVPYKVDRAGDTILMSPYMKAVTTPEVVDPGSGTVSVLLKDGNDDGAVTIHLQSRIDPKTELFGRIIAELRTVSPEYYYYQRSLARPHDLGRQGLSEPVILYNNVDQGLGVFAGYNSVEQGLDLLSY